MELLFRREQSGGAITSVQFKLWGKIELDDDEQEIVERYKFDTSILIYEDSPGLIKNSILIGALASIAGMVILPNFSSTGLIVGLCIGPLFGYINYHKNRETIYVKDLLHGRQFTCDTVIDLAKKEAWLTNVVSTFRQVMETAKHWDGTQRHTIEALPVEEARQAISRL